MSHHDPSSGTDLHVPVPDPPRGYAWAVRSTWAVAGMVVLAFVVGFIIGRTWEPSDRDHNPIRIGAILPLTGPGATAGEFQKKGIETAATRVNAAGGIHGRPVEVVFADSKNEAKEGLSRFRELVSLRGISILIATHSGVVVPLAEQVPDDGEALLLVSVSSAPDITKRSPFVFRNYVTSDNESRRMASFAWNRLHTKRVGVLYINDEFGIGGACTFKESFEKLGGAVAFEEPYERAAADFKSQLTKAVGSYPDVDAVYVIGYDRPFALVVKQLLENTEYKGPVLTSIGMSVPEWIALVGHKAEGVYMTATRFEPSSADPVIEEFVDEYRKLYRTDPNMIAGFTYDSLNLIAKAIRENGESPESVQKGLNNVADFSGVMGKITFDKFRETNIDLAIRQIKDGKAVLVEE